MGNAGRLALALVGLCGAAAALRGGVGADAAVALQLAAAFLAVAAAARRRLPAPPRGALALVLAWWGLALASVALASAPDRALDASGAVLATGLVFLVGCGLGAPERSALVRALTPVGAAGAAWALLMAASGERASLPFGNPNHLAGWLLVPGAVAAAGLFRAGTRDGGGRAGVAWFGALALMAAAVAASASRGAAIAALAAAAGVAGVAWLPRRRGALLVGGGLAAAALVLSVLPALHPGLVPRTGEGGESSAGIRWSVYAASARAAANEAPLGAGLGGFADAFAAVRPAGLPYAPRYAHSEILHGAVELGLPFLAVLLATAGAVLWAARAPGRGRERTLVWGGAAAGLAVAAHALVDFPLHVPAIAFALAAVAGAAWRAHLGVGPPAAAVSARLALLAGAAVLLAVAGTRAVALHAESVAETRLAAGDFEGAEVAAARGLAARPRRAELWRLSADAAEHAFELGSGGPEARERARAARRAAVRARPRSAALWSELAWARARRGDAAGALRAAERAEALDPASPAAPLARARLLLAEGRGEEAGRAVRRALLRHPVAAHPAAEALLRATADPALARAAVPENARAWLGAARALRGAGFEREAEAAFSEWRRLRDGKGGTERAS